MASQFLAILSDPDSEGLAVSISEQLGFVQPDIIHGNILDGAQYLQSSGSSPVYILIDAGLIAQEVIDNLDALAQHCVVNTKVIVIGDVNDLNLYRQLLQKGVTEYFVKPVQVEDIKEAFMRGAIKEASASSVTKGKVVSVFSSASGDGATSIATNLAYSLAKDFKQPTVLVDMDYQFGLVARNLDLAGEYGLKELYEHPEGSIDETLVDKTLVPYSDNLHIISTPRSLHFMPNISKNVIANLLYTLRKKFKFVILDLPHSWNEWVLAILKEVDHNLLVAQLSIKSVTHTTRILDGFEALGVPSSKNSVIVNRSGSKLKEPITAADFTMATKKKINFYISNDSKTMSAAEDQGVCALEVGHSILHKQIKEIASAMVNLNANKSIQEG